MATIFLSHSSKDKPFVRRLASVLKQQGIQVWMDEDELSIGDSLPDKLSTALMQTDYIGVILSPNSVSSEWVNKEIKAAIMDEMQKKRTRILPILYKDCEIPIFLQEKIFIDFRNSDTDQVIFDERITDLAGVLLGKAREAHNDQDTRASLPRLLAKEIEKITIIIELTTTGEINFYEVPLDAKTDVLLKKLVQEIDRFRAIDEWGVDWFFVNEKGKRLKGYLTLRQNGIQNEDVLHIEFEGEGE